MCSAILALQFKVLHWKGLVATLPLLSPIVLIVIKPFQPNHLVPLKLAQ